MVGKNDPDDERYISEYKRLKAIYDSGKRTRSSSRKRKRRTQSTAGRRRKR